MIRGASRFKRDVRSETSVFKRDVRSVCHAQTVTFEPEPSLSFCTPVTTDNPSPEEPHHMTANAAYVHCDAPGCEAMLIVDRRHVRNFEGREWSCREHDKDTD